MKHYPVQTITLNSGEIMSYRECGSGQSILLLHGNMTSSVHFQTTMEALESQYHVIACDLMGFGDSDYQTKRMSLIDYAKDVVELINHTELCDVTVLGWSTGGGVALELVALIPDRIKQVILLASVGLQGFKMYHKAPDKAGQLISEYDDIAQDPVQVIPVLEAYAEKNKAFLRFVCDATLYNLKQPETEEYDIYLDAILKQRNLVEIDYALVHFNMTHSSNGVNTPTGRMNLVRCPITIIHGEKDLVVSVEESKATYEMFKEQATLHIIEGAGHSVVTDNLQALVTIIKNVV